MDAYKLQLGCGCLYIIAGIAAFLSFWGIVLHFVLKWW